MAISAAVGLTSNDRMCADGRAGYLRPHHMQVVGDTLVAESTQTHLPARRRNECPLSLSAIAGMTARDMLGVCGPTSSGDLAEMPCSWILLLRPVQISYKPFR